MERVFNFIKENPKLDKPPDIFGIYEVYGKDVYEKITEAFPDYTFHMTYGPQTQEILVGARSNLSVFFTQRVEFKSGVSLLRPGANLTVRVDDVVYNLLFLHLKSGTDPRGWGLRDDMLERAVKFRKTLFDIATERGQEKLNYIFLGDLNIMGLEYPYKKDIDAETVLKRWDKRVKDHHNMRRLSKTYKHTFWNGTGEEEKKASSLDHVYVEKHMSFKKFETEEGKKEILVTGWVDEPDKQSKNKWIDEYSDHSLLYFEVEKPS
jgi:hypothetical protein